LTQNSRQNAVTKKPTYRWQAAQLQTRTRTFPLPSWSRPWNYMVLFLNVLVLSTSLTVVNVYRRSMQQCLCCRITLHQNDPRWVGAWWVGFVAVMVATLILAPVFFGYPPNPSTGL